MFRIVLGVDGSAGSTAALEHVLALAAGGLRCHVIVVAVQEPVYLIEVLLPPDTEVLERWTAAAGRRAIDQAGARLREAGVDFESELLTGDPAAALVDAAKRQACDLVVLGARGLGPVRGVLLGSVSQAVLQTAPVPVTIVHRPLEG